MPARSSHPSPAAMLCGALLASLAVGCSETKSSTPAEEAFVGRTCNVDEECGDLRCDPVRRHCVCRSDEDCAVTADCANGGAACTTAGQCCSGSCDSGRCAACASEGDGCGAGCCSGLTCGDDGKCVVPVCNNFTGLCVAALPGCRADLECPPGTWCDRSVRACKARKGFCEPCTSNLECGGEADLCVLQSGAGSRVCGTSCDPQNQNRDCLAMAGSGASCQSVAGAWQCLPKEGRTCELFVGCVPDSRTTCRADADCDQVADQVCDQEAGICVARVRSCPFGQTCDPRGKVCVDACVSDADCIAIDPSLRCVDRGCEAPAACAATAADPSGDSVCPPNRVCSLTAGLSTGLCVPFCSANGECPPGSVCQRSPQGRYRCSAGCQTNADCLPEEKCYKQAGATLGACAGAQGETCQADNACAICSSCDLAASQCVADPLRGYCKPCSADADCGEGHCLDLESALTGQLETRCGQPCPRAGCPHGFVCAEVCVGGEYLGYQCSGRLVAECIPVDQSCTVDDGGGARTEKCVWSQ
jgi:hypothetical protein